ncbi:SAM-dependent methyltransferase [Streptomyces actinomycinicus]|uniref:SAM-dependent methyltransferase n=1 Tax=Streptomyces actinomycinicus TaxID=1695166 RepID=A0A937EP54_9ACTN|nr:SAM-dependent methyltransferase [Streptomyces actinomycinicus]MBL1086932.1 SAM-dependent methyltransferase [Streptomyces actinomycinicus]
MTQDGFKAADIDTSRPHPARIYDYLLGGKDHYPVDRRAGDELTAAAPEARIGVRANRAFLQRAVRYVVGSGVRQILDIGTGLPTSPNVHEVAQSAAPDVRVAYVDNDPIVAAHGNALLSRSGTTRIVLGDLRDPRSVLDHPDVRHLIDFDEPVALLLVAILHFLADTDRPAEVVATLREALPAGSYLVLSHATGDFADRTAAQAVYSRATASLNLRSRAEVERFFDGFELVEPGLAQVPFWRPDAPPPARSDEIGFYGGVARKAA